MNILVLREQEQSTTTNVVVERPTVVLPQVFSPQTQVIH